MTGKDHRDLASSGMLGLLSLSNMTSNKQPSTTKPHLTASARRANLNTLLRLSVDGELPHGARSFVARVYNRDPATIGRLWDRHTAAEAAGIEGGDASSHLKGRAGRKPRDRVALVTKIRGVPVAERTTRARLAAASGVSRRLLGRLISEGYLRRVTDRISPTLTDQNEVARLQFVLSHLDEDTLTFDPGYDVVHVDEKWFNEDKDDRAYFLLDGEVPPPRSRKSKRFIPKTMFLAAVARPRFDPGRGEMFDGKIGLWPLTATYTAQRDSVNRKKGSLCVRNVVSVNRPLYKHYIIDHVIPSIKAKWPAHDRGRTIFIQQDNATPHLLPCDPDVIAAGTADGWNIRLLFQPPNSPDLNVLDLGFFASIQSIQYRQPTTGIENLINAVQRAFDDTNVDTLDNIFLTLQGVMQCILQHNGGNRYPLPHMGKAALRKRGELPASLKCDPVLYELATRALEDAGSPMLF